MVAKIKKGDRVLVMDNGQVAEYDSPANLLAQRGSLLSKLVEADKQQLPGRSESTV